MDEDELITPTKRAILKARRRKVAKRHKGHLAGVHFVDVGTEQLFTKQGAVLVRDILPKAGIELQISAKPGR